jgi:hypothetical protein
MSTTSTPRTPQGRRGRTDRLPVWRIGLTGGAAGILCCVGPTVLALLGIVSAGTAFVWATECSLAGVRRWR